jgi:flagellar L-ring protein FlgH
MLSRTIICSLLLSFVVCCGTNLRADSIWTKRNVNKRDLYSDNTARTIGDVLTILISETSKLDNKSTRTLSKETTRNQNFNGEVGIEHIIDEVPAVNFGTGTKYSNKLDGKSDFKDERAFIDSVSVVVRDVMPNGNLVVFGTCYRNISDDTQIIEVSGIVRVRDIEFNNSIQSRRVANFSIITRNKGVGAQYTRPNWMGRIMDVIWPF